MSLPLTVMGDTELRMGIEPLELLLAARAELVKEIAPLRALHGPFGSWQDLRKIELSRIAVGIRAQAAADGKKITEAGVDELAHSDERYISFLTQGVKDKTRYFEIEDRIAGIADQINRGQSISRYLAAEVMLAR